MNKLLLLLTITFSMDVSTAKSCKEILSTFLGSIVVQHEFQVPLIAGDRVTISGRDVFTDIYVNLDGYENLDHLAWILSEGRETKKVRSALENFQSRGELKVSLTAFLPKHTRELVNNHGYASFFNCFNFALRKNHPEIPFGNTEDMKLINDLLVSNYTFLDPWEKLKFGDIILVRDSGKDGSLNLVHAAIYMGNDLILHKPSKAGLGRAGLNVSPVVFEDLESALHRYNRLPQPYGEDSNPFIQKGDLYLQAVRAM